MEQEIQVLRDRIEELNNERRLLKEKEERVQSAITWFKWVVGLSIPFFAAWLTWIIRVETNLSAIQNDVQWIKASVIRKNIVTSKVKISELINGDL